MRKADIVVLGLGAMGSAALYHLARRGVVSVGIEQYQLGHPFGSSHGHSRAFRVFYHDPIYVELAQTSLSLWQELEARSGERLLTLNGALIFAQPGNLAFDQNMQVMENLRIPCQVLSAEQVADRFPALRLLANSVACYLPGSGFINATRSVQAHLSQARQLGATIQERVRVHRLDLSGDRPILDTSDGQYRCDRLIVTPGPWASDLLAELALPLKVTRQQKFYFQPQHDAAYQPNRLPVFADYDQQYYGFPYYGLGIKVADDHDGTVTSPEIIDRTLDWQQRDRLQAWLEMIMPGINSTFVEGATCMYTTTPDRDFLIGPHPKHPRVLVGAGFSGHGFKFSTLVGQILAELATEGATRQPIERFRLNRFKE